jgi:hypothetical protein
LRLGVLIMCCALTLPAAADPAVPRAVALRLEADPQCVSVEQLRRRVAAPTWRWSDDAEAGAQLALAASVLRQPDGGLSVELQVRWPDGRSAERSVAAGSCEASLHALALLVQMTLDAAQRPREQAPAGTRPRPSVATPPKASTPRSSQAHSGDRPGVVLTSVGASTPSVAPVNSEARPGVVPTSVGDSTPSVAPVNSEARRRIAPTSVVPTNVEPTSRVPATGAELDETVTQGVAAAAVGGEPNADGTERWSSVSDVAAGASLGLGAGAAPGLQPGVGVFAALGLRGIGMLRPWLQLELAHAWSNASLPAGRADFALDGGQLLLCPIAWSSAYLAAHGCGAFELAQLRARGYDTYAPRSQARAWASAGAGLLVRAPVWKLELQLGALLLHPLWRDQFSFAPDVFYAVPAWRWQLKLGLGVRFL